MHKTKKNGMIMTIQVQRHLRRSQAMFSSLLLAVVLFTLATGNAMAQFGSASVLGYVRDNSGAFVPSAKVTLINVATNVAQTAQTDKDGKYEFDSVPIGNYQVTTDASGFEATRTETFNVSTDARQRVDVAIKPGHVNEVVEVTSAAQLLDTETSSRSQVIGTREVENLPLNGRSYADLVLLAPGTRKSLLENQSASSREGAFNINGQRSAFNEFLLDGLENSNYGTSNQGFEDENISPSPDAVSEFRVETNNYSAEYGRQPGAIVNVSTRSGDNQFHGRAWDYLRNTNLNAVGPIEPITNTKPKLIRNQFGGTFGGPIIKDHTFFFADYEGLRQIFNYQLAPVTLPNAEQRLGRFLLHRVDGTTAPIPLYNPVTGTSYSTGDISAGSTPFALAVLGFLPSTNVGGSSVAYNNITNNYSNAPRGTIKDDKGDARVDQNFTKWKLFGRYSDHQESIFDPPTIGGRSGGNANSNVVVQNRQVAGGATWIISQNRLLDIRFAWTRNIGAKTPYSAGQQSLLTQYGITDGLPTDPMIVRSLNGQSISGFTQLGNQTSSPQFQNPTIYNPKVNYTWVHGKQSMKVGYELQLIHTQINDFNPSYGQDNYASQYAAGPSSTFFPTCTAAITTGCIPTDTATGNTASTQIAQAREVADFLFGNRSSYSLTNYTVVNLRQRYNAGYFQDDLKLTPNLTVNAGLRYEVMTPQFERDNKLANFNPTNNTLTQASGGSIYNRSLVHTPSKNFAPRFGFSYTADQKTVLRGGYGIVYVQFNRAGGENNLTYNGPNVVNASINNPSPFVTPIGSNLCASDTQNQATCFRQTQQGYASTLTSPANFNPLLVTSRYIPSHFQTGYVQSYFLGVQRQLPHGILLDLAYVGNKSTHLQILADYNQAAPCLLPSVTACNAAGQTYQARRPVPTFGDIEIATNEGSATYNSLQFKAEKRMGALYVLNAFTYSRAFDLSSGHLETSNGDNSRVNFANPRNDYGPSGYDQPLDNTTSIVWDLPYGHGRRYGAQSSALSNILLGGWQMTVINTMTSGLPFNITYSSSTTNSSSTGPLFTTDLATLRPQHLAGTPLKSPGSAIVKASKYTGLTNYLPFSSYALPSYALYGNTTAYGNISRNILRSYAFYNTDLGLHKQFPIINERYKLDLRAEAFNILNHTNWQGPDGAITDGSGSFGSITSAFPSRQLQFAAKFLF
jgi:hypothetical protein